TAEIESLLVALHLEATAVDGECRAFLDADVDIALHLLHRFARYQRTVIGGGIDRGADLERLHARDQLFHQAVSGCLADGDRDRNRHAAPPRLCRARAAL